MGCRVAARADDVRRHRDAVVEIAAVDLAEKKAFGSKQRNVVLIESRAALLQQGQHARGSPEWMGQIGWGFGLVHRLAVAAHLDTKHSHTFGHQRQVVLTQLSHHSGIAENTLAYERA